MPASSAASTPVVTPTSVAMRRLFWLCVFAWAIVSWFAGDEVALGMKWRINDLSSIPGAGYIERDPEGVFYHVDAEGHAVKVYAPAGDGSADSDQPAPAISGDTGAASVDQRECLECTLVTGEQLSQTNDFCAAGVKSRLPNIEFEVPCKSWAPISEGPKVVSVTIFLLPLLLIPVLRMSLAAVRRRQK